LLELSIFYATIVSYVESVGGLQARIYLFYLNQRIVIRSWQGGSISGNERV
jgi:hypothetical protein